MHALFHDMIERVQVEFLVTWPNMQNFKMLNSSKILKSEFLKEQKSFLETH